MAYGEPLDSILNLLSSIFILPTYWFGFPQVIFFFIIPLIGLISLWTILLTRFLRIFQSSGANFGIAVILSLLSTPLIRVFTPTYIMAITVGASFIFYGEVKAWKMIAALILFLIMIFIYPKILEIVELSYY